MNSTDFNFTQRFPAPHRLIGWQLLTLVLLCLAANLVFAQGQLSAKVDRPQIGLEETLKLEVRYNEQVMFDEPDFSALEENFDILGSHRSNQFRSVNGRAESWTQWSLTLAPKKEGKLLIPSFEFEGSYSEAIEVMVKKTVAPTGQSTDKPLFLETEISQSQAYVQEQVLYTVRLFTSVDINALDRGEVSVTNALVKPVSESQYQRTVNGKPYAVLETTYAIFPQQSGELEIPSALWTVAAQTQSGYRYDPFLNRGSQRFRLRTDAKSLSVLPKPGSYSGQFWLPARDIELSQSWSTDPDNFKVGEPITRTITVKAKGLMASQLPPLNLDEINGVKYYPDQPQSNETVSAEGIMTIKTESYAIVPNRSGEITLPGITLTWWDTQAKRMREANLPVQTIQVAAGSNASQQPAAPADDQYADAATANTPLSPLEYRGPWFYSTLAFALSSLVFALLWLRNRSGNDAQPKSASPKPATAASNEKQMYKQLRTSLQQGDPGNIRAQLLAWAKCYSGDASITSLQQLAQRLPPLTDAVNQLEASLYGQAEGASVDVASLEKALVAIRRHGVDAPSDSNKSSSSLPPLYS